MRIVSCVLCVWADRLFDGHLYLAQTPNKEHNGERAIEKKEGERGGEREECRRKDNLKRQRSHQREDAATDKKKGRGGGNT